MINRIVTPSILKMDKLSCENLLNSLLDQKKEESFMKQIK
jgi:hypothetical protein